MTTLKAGARIPVKDQKTSRFVESQLPSIVVDMESLIVPFLKAYYEWMERENEGVVYDIRRLLDLQDVNKTTTDFINFFMEEFLPGIPKGVLADKRLLLKHAKEIHSSKGTEDSFRFLFRILYNEDVEISYPKDDLFRSSDAIWVKESILKISKIDPNLSEIVGRRIFGTESNATAIVDRITFSIEGSDEYASLFVTNIYGNFLVDEAIETRDEHVYIVGRCLGHVGKVNIQSSGTGYVVGEVIPISDMGDGKNFTSVVSTVGVNGEIKKISIIDSGVFFFSNPPIPNISAMSGTGASFSFEITSVHDADGRFVDDSCMTSSTKRLQDGKLYQEFSYVLKSGVSINIFKDHVKRLVHPAGFFMGSLMVALGNAGIPIKVGVYNDHDINYDNPDHPSSRAFFDTVVRREYAPDEVWEVSKIDQFYPNGIPTGKNIVRIFSPEGLYPLYIGSRSNVRAENSILMIEDIGHYVIPIYVDHGYYTVNMYPGIAASNVFIIGPVDEVLTESGFNILLESGEGNVIME